MTQSPSGMVIAEITTEKITYELEAQAEGVLLKIILPEEGEAQVGAPIAVIGRPGEDVSAFGGLRRAEGTPPGVVQSACVGRGAAGPVAASAVAGPRRGPGGARSGGRITAPPAAKKLAAELGVDIATVAGTGPGGRITLEDVAQPQQRPAATGAARTAAAEAFATPVAKKLAAELGVDLAGVAGSGPSGRVRAEDVAPARRRVRRGRRPGAEPRTSAGEWSRDPLRGHAPSDRRAHGREPQACAHGHLRRAGRRSGAQAGFWPESTLTRPDDDKVNVTAVIVKAVALTLRGCPGSTPLSTATSSRSGGTSTWVWPSPCPTASSCR